MFDGPGFEGEVQELREELEELRVDFAERLLARQKTAGALPPEGGR